MSWLVRPKCVRHVVPNGRRHWGGSGASGSGSERAAVVWLSVVLGLFTMDRWRVALRANFVRQLDVYSNYLFSVCFLFCSKNQQEAVSQSGAACGRFVQKLCTELSTASVGGFSGGLQVRLPGREAESCAGLVSLARRSVAPGELRGVRRAAAGCAG